MLPPLNSYTIVLLGQSLIIVLLFRIQFKHVTSISSKIYKAFLGVPCLYGAWWHGVDQMQLLSRFNKLRLLTRRQIQSIKFLYKLLHNAIDCPFLPNEVSFRVPRIGSRHRADFSLDKARSKIVQQNPIYLMCSSFNTLSNLCDIYYHNLGFIVNSFVSTK